MAAQAWVQFSSARGKLQGRYQGAKAISSPMMFVAGPQRIGSANEFYENPQRVASYLAPIEALARRDLDALSQSIVTQKSKDLRLPYPAAWWLHLSNLQKAIRRGDVAQALDSAERLYRQDPVKLRRRLAVIALEDVSFGHLLIAAITTIYTASAEKHASEQDLARCLGFVQELACGAKDRLIAELIGASTDSPKRRDSILKIAAAGAGACVALYRDKDADLRDRSVAGLALAGALIVDGKRVGERDRNALVAAASAMDLPDVARLIVECSLKIGGEVAALAVNVPVLYKRMRDQVARVERPQLPEAILIEGLISAAYDQHTRAGLRALSTYRLRWKPLAQFLRKNVGDPSAAIKTLAFRVEGSALDRELVCALGDEVFAWNEEAQCDAIGMEYAALPAAKHLFLGGLPALNVFRQQAIATELQGVGS